MRFPKRSLSTLTAPSAKMKKEREGARGGGWVNGRNENESWLWDKEEKEPFRSRGLFFFF